MKPQFSMLSFLKVFSVAVLLISLSFNPLLLAAVGTSIHLTPSLMANALLLTGILGILIAHILADQKRELDKLKTDLALLSNSKENR
jgi:hypothetical protein